MRHFKFLCQITCSLALVLALFSCQKEDTAPIQEHPPVFQFSKEITVTDSLRQNKIQLRVSSDDEHLVNSFSGKDFLLEALSALPDTSGMSRGQGCHIAAPGMEKTPAPDASGAVGIRIEFLAKSLRPGVKALSLKSNPAGAHDRGNVDLWWSSSNLIFKGIGAIGLPFYAKWYYNNSQLSWPLEGWRVLTIWGGYIGSWGTLELNVTQTTWGVLGVIALP